MPKLKQRLDELLQEDKTRVEAHKVRSAAVRSPDEEPLSRDWPSFRGLSDEKIEKKLARLPEHEMEKLYIKLEREMGFRIDPENYKRHKIIKNFMTLWSRKKEDEAKKPTEKWIPLTERELARIMGDGSRNPTISSKPTLIGRK